MNTLAIEGLQALLLFPGRDPRWKPKLLTGFLLGFLGMFIPLLPGFIIQGYGYRLARRVIKGESEPVLPEWVDWGKLFVDGLKVSAVTLVYLLPALILFFLGWLILFSPLLAIPFLAGSQKEDLFFAVFFFLQIFGMAVFTLGILLGVLAGLFIPAAINHMIDQDSFGAAFQIGNWWKVMRANFGAHALAYLAYISLGYGLTGLLYFLVIPLLFCAFPAMLAMTLVFFFYWMLIGVNLFAQTYRQGVQKLSTA